MNNAKRILAVLLAACLALGLCACGGTNESPETTEAPVVTTAPAETGAPETEAPVDDGKVAYTVTVVDEEGNPVSGVIVQWCLETCFPGVTDASGVATYTAVEADYHVQINSMPQGYTYSTDEQEFSYESGSTEMTIVLKAEG